MVPWTAGCGYQVFFLISRILYRDLTSKMFMWNPIGPIFQIFGLKKNPNNKYFRKNFCMYKKRYPFAYLWNKMWNYFWYFNHNF